MIAPSTARILPLYLSILLPAVARPSLLPRHNFTSTSPTPAMSRHARIEEVSDSDSDPSEMDPSDFDPGLLNSIIQPANIPSTTPEYSQQQQPVLQPHFPGRVTADQNAERERTKHYQCLYPIYFDSSRSRAEGRRVAKNDAVANPLAQDIANACSQLPVAGQVVFEPANIHPKD